MNERDVSIIQAQLEVIAKCATQISYLISTSWVVLFVWFGFKMAKGAWGFFQ